MRVYLHGSENKPPVPLHVMTVNPAAHGKGKVEAPGDWVDENNRGVEFTVEFVHGTAEVEPRLGKYLIDAGLAHRTRLVLPGYFGP
jgi:hypothetical protein